MPCLTKLLSNDTVSLRILPIRQSLYTAIIDREIDLLLDYPYSLHELNGKIMSVLSVHRIPKRLTK